MAGIQLARKLVDGTVEPRKRGRQPQGAVMGYIDEAGDFHEGKPRKTRGRRGRRAGSATGKRGRPGVPRVGTGTGLLEIEAIVKREVRFRLQKAKDAALMAFNKALGV